MNIFDQLADADPEGKKRERAYTMKEAEMMSGGLDCRTMEPTSRYEFLTCQIGELKVGGFHLMAFGVTWNAALHMLALRKGAILANQETSEPVSEPAPLTEEQLFHLRAQQ
jgi:hypothetical protein